MYKPEYNVQSFFWDLSEIRRKTFTKKTIKHSFKNTSIWPVSFKQVQRKLQEYRKKKKKKGSFDILEFGSDSEVELVQENIEDDKADSMILLVHQMTSPPSNYNECYTALKSLDSKVQEALSSLSCT